MKNILLLISFILLLATCKKDNYEKDFLTANTKVSGTAIDYFDKAVIANLQVKLVRDYIIHYADPGGFQPPDLDRFNIDTIQTVTTNSNGKFEFEFFADKYEKASADIRKNHPDTVVPVDYYIVFIDNGNYFTQLMHIDNPTTDKKQNKTYGVKPYVTIEYNISSNKPDVAVIGNVYAYAYTNNNNNFHGKNINGIKSVTVKWESRIETGCDIGDSLTPSIYYYSNRQFILPTLNNYHYEINY